MDFPNYLRSRERGTPERSTQDKASGKKLPRTKPPERNRIFPTQRTSPERRHSYIEVRFGLLSPSSTIPTFFHINPPAELQGVLPGAAPDFRSQLATRFRRFAVLAFRHDPRGHAPRTKPDIPNTNHVSARQPRQFQGPALPPKRVTQPAKIRDLSGGRWTERER